jgi:hypothetical protein
MVTKIFVKANQLTEWSQLDLLDDLTMSLNYAIFDIRDLGNREGNYSKTITIPGTKANNELFTDIFEIDINGTFNPALKSDVEVLIDDVSIFRGTLQLLRVKTIDTNFIQYDVQVVGNAPTLFSELGDQTVTALDFSDLDHAYTYANVTASWTPTLGEGYVYPLINYDQTVTNFYQVVDFLPAIFTKEYWDRIFTLAGYTYDSAFINSTYFKSLIIPYSGSGLRLTNTDVQDRTFRASLSGFYETPDIYPANTPYNPLFLTIAFDDDSTSPNFDTGGNYNTSSGRFTAQNAGFYNINSDLSFVGRLLASGVLEDTTPTVTLQSGVQNVFLNATDYVNLRIRVNWLDVIPGLSRQFVVRVEYIKNGTTVLNTVLLPGGLLVVTGTGNEMKLRVAAGSTYYNGVATDTISEGMTMLMNNTLPPPDTKLRDILMSLIRMFNLYFEVDPDNPKNLIIEPRDSYYLTGSNNALDWTDKLDESKELTITPLGELDSKSFLFTYKPDTDYYNAKYQKTTNDVYGKWLQPVVNDFSKDEKKVDVIFSPTPLVGNAQSNRIVPHIYQFDEQNNTISRKATNIRILFWGGLLSSTPAYNIVSGNPTPLGGGGTIYSLTQYPYAGHLDNPYTPDFDLCWGLPQELFYGYNQYIAPPNLEYTNNTLYNKFYKSLIDEISDPDSKIVSCYMRLTPEDMEFLSFRRIYTVKGYYYRLQKIEDYNPISNAVTKVEFLKIKDGQNFQFTKEVLIGGSLGTIGTDIAPSFVVDGKPFNGEVRPGNIIRFGSGGFLDSSSTQLVINGNNNNVHGGNLRISINGNDNTVYAGSSGVTMLNSSGCTLLGNNQNITLENCFNCTIEDGVSNVNAVGFTNYTFYSSGTYLFNPIRFEDRLSGVMLDLDDPAIFTANVLTIPSQYVNNNDFILMGASTTYEVQQIIGIPNPDMRFRKGGSITSLKFTNGTYIFTPSPSSYALLDGTSEDYIIMRKAGSAVKQLEVNVY